MSDYTVKKPVYGVTLYQIFHNVQRLTKTLFLPGSWSAMYLVLLWDGPASAAISAASDVEIGPLPEARILSNGLLKQNSTLPILQNKNLYYLVCNLESTNLNML
jgi:hypothetical protein